MKKVSPTGFASLVAFAFSVLSASGEFMESRGIVYRDGADRCRLDIRVPAGGNGFATYVFFHGGGLAAGERCYPYWPEGDESLAQVAAGYRFLQDASVDDVIDDAALAVSWVLEHIAEYGGDPSKVFVGGHSAGGYLACMVGMDASRLGRHGHSPSELKGLIPVSGQVTAHFNVRKFSGDADNRFLPKLGELAPMNFADREFAPVCSICGDRRIEVPCRVEENELMISSIRNCDENRRLDEFHECPGRDHGSVALDAPDISRAFVRKVLGEPVLDSALWKEVSAMWETPGFVRCPSFDRGAAKAIAIDGEPWRGKATRFFAYYAVPEGASAENPVPGIVLVHGGGGTAFADWAETWAARGYAAIAMDNCGGIPLQAEGFGDWMRHPMSGPEGWDAGFATTGEPFRDQWTYHAVSTVIRSHSFLRSLDCVDGSRIGVTGISWGGYLVSCAAGIDDRFLFAAPVYGCGHLLEHSAWSEQLAGLGSAGERWDGLWDPRNYLPAAGMPVLWCTGSNDFAYPLDSLQKSYSQLPQAPWLSIKIRMLHGHPPAGDPPEITAFADHWSFGRPMLPKIETVFENGVVSARWDSPGREIVKAELIGTSSDGDDWQARPFWSEELSFSGNSLETEPPPEAVLFWVNLTDSQGLVSSSRHFCR